MNEKESLDALDGLLEKLTRSTDGHSAGSVYILVGRLVAIMTAGQLENRGKDEDESTEIIDAVDDLSLYVVSDQVRLVDLTVDELKAVLLLVKRTNELLRINDPQGISIIEETLKFKDGDRSALGKLDVLIPEYKESRESYKTVMSSTVYLRIMENDDSSI